ncbi:hypothetical protein EW146_g51 [Bondarzewia mesenterica]|uniref:U6 snRNA phosphodiesterase 1 n=1 Tax=Bondarzewia mesenterica TaxID=1095465 RepID=A0A4S4M8H9_9AGAM|nr:hypothetical protein EW146_g51 [Bondarzewia mesenterica]
MKRSFTPLVAYAGSDDDEDKDTPHPPSPPEKKKRKLPPLASQLTVPIPVDDPSRHQGRSRSTPHVEGQWAAYVYVPVSVGGRERRGLRRLVRRVVDRARERVPSLRVVETDESVERKEMTEEEEASEELHISLSRPIFIRSHQREDVKRAVKAIAKAHPPIAPRAVNTGTRFTASFAALAELINDERTRMFLCMEVGAGHDQLRALSDALSPLLRSLRQKPYYEHPRFHASLAWALLDRPTPQESHDAKVASPPPPSPSPPADTDTPTSECPSPARRQSPSLVAPGPPFPTIPGFPPDLVASLNAEFGNEIASGLGVFEVEEIQVRIGKEVFGWNIGV